jgi:hypothetical protein
MAKKNRTANGVFKPTFGQTWRTFPGRLIFPHIARASTFKPGQEEKFSASLILKPSPRLTEILEDIEKTGSKAFSDWDESYYRPIISGEQCMEKSEKCRAELYAGNYRLLCKGSLTNKKGEALAPPACYLADGSKMPRGPGNEEHLKAIEHQFYPGCYCIVGITPFAFDVGNSKGVGLIFKGIKFIKDDTRLVGADIEAVMAEDDDFGTDYEFDETGFASEEATEVNI